MSRETGMNKPLFKHECRSHLKSVGVWSLSLTVMLFIFFPFYPIFAEQASTVDLMLKSLPPEFLSAIGLSGTDFSSVLGYYGYIFIFIQLCLAIQAANYGVGLISIEENEATADFLLSKPVSRTQIILTKFIAAFLCLLITNFIVWVSSYAAVEVFRNGHSYETRTLLLLFLTIPLFQFFFLSIGLMLSLLTKRVRNVLPFSLGLAFGTYILNAFGEVFSEIDLELITPFKHFDPNFILKNNTINTNLVTANFIAAILMLFISYWLFLRRDIPAIS